jgi:hypothetical protein
MMSWLGWVPDLPNGWCISIRTLQCSIAVQRLEDTTMGNNTFNVARNLKEIRKHKNLRFAFS